MIMATTTMSKGSTTPINITFPICRAKCTFCIENSGEEIMSWALTATWSLADTYAAFTMKCADRIVASRLSFSSERRTVECISPWSCGASNRLGPWPWRSLWLLWFKPDRCPHKLGTLLTPHLTHPTVNNKMFNCLSMISLLSEFRT